MEALFLVASGPIVVPRLANVTLSDGSGKNVFRASCDLAPEWRASVGNAIEAARGSARAAMVDVEVRVPGTTALTGMSAGLPIGLAVMAAIRGDALPRHIATGGVVDERGTLVGGAAAQRKGEAAADLARLNAWGDELLFVVPPVKGLPRVEGVRFVSAPDLQSAYRVLTETSDARSPSATNSSRSAAASRATSSDATSG